MRFQLTRKMSILALLAAATAGCGNGANFNKIWGSDDGGLDSLIAQAKINYDKGDFDKAEDFALKAYEINEDNEDAAIILGYVYLSKGGIDPFLLAKKLVCLGSNNNDASKCTSSSSSASALRYDEMDGYLAEHLYANELQTSGSSSSSSSSSSSASGSLGSLSKTLSAIISLSDDDMKTLGIDSSKGDDSATGIFAGLPVYSPATVTEELRGKIPTLDAMNKAIKYVCPFVESGVFVSGDPRDTACVTTTQSRRLTYKAHFLWAFTHLTEAVIFQNVLLYSADGVGGTSNLEARSSKLNSFSGSVTDFVSAVTSLQTSVDAVFSTSTADGVSQLTATLNALTSVSNAFAKLPGMPSSISSQITKSIEQLQELGKKVTDATSATSGQATALKAQMTEKMSTTLKTTIDSQCSKQTCSADEQQKLCTSFDSISKGADTSKVTKPTICE